MEQAKPVRVRAKANGRESRQVRVIIKEKSIKEKSIKEHKGGLEHQAWPGPRGKTCCLHLDALASSCSAPCAAGAGRPSLPAALAAGAGAVALAWDGIRGRSRANNWLGYPGALKVLR